MSLYIPEFEIDYIIPENDFFNLNTKKKSPLIIDINRKEYSEFNGLRLSYAIDSGCAAFSFDTIFNPSKGLSNDIKPFGNEEITIYYKEEYVFNGILEKITTGYSNSGSNINIQGRSKSGILLDTQVKGGNLNNSTIETLSQNFGFTNIKAPKDNFIKFDWNSGDNAFDILSKYAAQKGLWAVPRFDGSLEFINFTKLTDPSISIEDGKENVLSITATYDVTKRFSEYVGFKKGYAQKSIFDNTINNRGKKFFRADDNNGDLDKVAKLGRSKSISESMTFSVILSTWEWAGKLFQPGILVNVISPLNLIYKKSKFCIKQVDFIYDINSGFITELQLCLPSVFTLQDADLEFFQNYKDLSILDKNKLSKFLKIPDNREMYDKTIGKYL